MRKVIAIMLLVSVVCPWLFGFDVVAMAANTIPLKEPTIGGVAENVLAPTSTLTQIIYALCYVIGTALILGSAILYQQHRNNPVQTRLSQVIFLLIFGICVVAVPLIAQYSPGSRSVA